MRDTIEHFMWGYQEPFRHAVEREAQRILDSLRPGLDARAFLVGVPIDPKPGRHTACVEPEVHHWADSSEFYDVVKDVAAIQATYPESQLSHSHPVAQTREDDILFLRGLRDAVVRRLEACPKAPQNIRIFASFPAERDGFLVITVITVVKSVFDDIPSVVPDSVPIHEHRWIRVPSSLVEAAIDEIHTRANIAIIQPDAGTGLRILGHPDEILRQAAVRFFSGLLYRIDRDSMMIGIAAEVFDNVSRLAKAPYERAEPRGRLVFAAKSEVIGAPALILAKPLALRRARALRKLLVLTDDELTLRCNWQSAFALIRDSSRDAPSVVTVQIVGRDEWIVSSQSRDVMIIKDGLPSLPHPEVDEAWLARSLQRVIRSMTEESAGLFARIGARLASSGHGSILVVTEDAAEEAVRLGAESLPVAPVGLTPELAQKLTEIDGALLCDPDGRCHAIGVILDGRASNSGDPGRGSRFNSAVRYTASSSTPAATIVVSDDGGLDLLPRLPPTLSRNKLASKLDELRDLAMSPSSPLDRDREIDVIDWIGRHAFYLSDSQCGSANEWITTCEERFHRDAQIRVVRSPLRTDPSFDPDRDLT